MHLKTTVATALLILSFGAAPAFAGEDPSQGDDAPGCTPWISGPVQPGDCGAGTEPESEPNEGRPNGAGDWEPEAEQPNEGRPNGAGDWEEETPAPAVAPAPVVEAAPVVVAAVTPAVRKTSTPVVEVVEAVVVVETPAALPIPVPELSQVTPAVRFHSLLNPWHPPMSV